MSKTPKNAPPIRVADLKQNRPTPFELRLNSTDSEALRADLDLIGLRKVSLVGEIRASGKTDWVLSATLGATVIQPCAVTLEPVTTRLDVPVERHYLAEMDMPEAEGDDAEVEMPEDENAEALGAEINLDQVLSEALALNLPLYPRAEGAALGESVFTEPGKTAMRDEDTRPFAGLAGLRDKLSEDGEK